MVIRTRVSPVSHDNSPNLRFSRLKPESDKNAVIKYSWLVDMLHRLRT